MSSKIHNTRLLPDGKTPPMKMEPGVHNKVVVHVEGGEAPGAMTPDAGGSEGGASLPNLGEKFSVNPVMGAGGASVGFALPPGRALTPGLGLGYDSNRDNGPYGQGWETSLPYFVRASTRPHLAKDGSNHGRGVPTYDDAAESDVFIFSDAAELVKCGEAKSVLAGFNVTAYRARIEGGFARVERFEKDGVSHWRVRTPDNVVSVFGQDRSAQLVDPEDPTRVFRWNLERQVDPLGNVTLYRYTRDDAGEHAYLTRILYGNREVYDVPLEDTAEGGKAEPAHFMFEVRLDYGAALEGDAASDDVSTWDERPDVLHLCRGGFQTRIRRLLRGVRVFHRFEALGGNDTPKLVSHTRLAYEEDPLASRLVEVSHTAFDDDDKPLTLPPRTFGYRKHALNVKARTLDVPNLDLSGEFTDATVLDLHGTAVPGVLVRRLGEFLFHRGLPDGAFGPAQKIEVGASASVALSLHRQRFLDLDGDGRPALVELGVGEGEFWERDADGGFIDGQTFGSVPPVADAKQPGSESEFPRVLWGDLDGDGRADALVIESPQSAPQVHQFETENEGRLLGWKSLGWAELPDSEAEDVLRDPKAAVFLADVTGDGMADLLHITASAVAYWPGLGRGRFGAKREVDAPAPGVADPSRVRLLDIDGCGGVDILILGDGGGKVLRNENGNRFVQGASFKTPHPDTLGLSALVRLHGRATASFVFARAKAGAKVTCVDFIAGEAGAIKPMLLDSEDNSLGLKSTITYASSTKFFLEDEKNGKTPWLTRMPFCVPVVEHVESHDKLADVVVATTYRYRHGCWAGDEREFRGFGYVSQMDTEEFGKKSSGNKQRHDAEHFSPPVQTKSWFHLGVAGPQGPLSEAYASEFSTYDPHVPRLPEPPTPSPDHLRALKGLLLRVESFARDAAQNPDDPEAEAKAERPFAIAVHGYTFVDEAAAEGEHHPSLCVVGNDALSYTYDRKEEADPRLSQSVSFDHDAYGIAHGSATVAYPRRVDVPEPSLSPTGEAPQPASIPQGQLGEDTSHAAFASPHAPLGAKPPQLRDQLVRSEVKLTHVDEAQHYRVGLVLETASFAQAGLGLDPKSPNNAFALAGITGGELLGKTRHSYLAGGSESFETVDKEGLPHSTWSAAFSQAQFDAAFAGDPQAKAALGKTAYVEHDGLLWSVSGHAEYGDAARFFLPLSSLDAFGNRSYVAYDDDHYHVVYTQDAKGNAAHSTLDYRVLSPKDTLSPNGVQSFVTYDALGRPLSTRRETFEGDGNETEAHTRFEYSNFASNTKPNFVKAKHRVEHQSAQGESEVDEYETIQYVGGSGSTLQSKVAVGGGVFRANSQNIVNNKGKTVVTTEPHESGEGFDGGPGQDGENKTLRYDGLGRVTKVEHRDGTFEETRFDSWQSVTFDAADTSDRNDTQNKHKAASEASAAHVDTPTTTLFDTLGRPYAVFEHLEDPGDPGDGQPQARLLVTRTTYDAAGNVLDVIDPKGRVAEAYLYGLGGLVLGSANPDTGMCTALPDVDGQLVYARRGDVRTRTTYDELRRPLTDFLTEPGQEEIAIVHRVYVDAQADTSKSNFDPSTEPGPQEPSAPVPPRSYSVGKLYRVYDGGGMQAFRRHDFDGHPIDVLRILPQDPKSRPDWTPLLGKTTLAELDTAAAELLEDDRHFVSRAQYDARGRIQFTLSPQNTLTRYRYRKDGLLKRVDRAPASADGDQAPALEVPEDPLLDPSVTGEDRDFEKAYQVRKYDPFGRAREIVRGNDAATTTYDYDKKNHRLSKLRSTAGGKTLQNLHYDYDAVGNIVRIEDKAQSTHHDGGKVEPVQRFRYDSLYRLVQAHGREHQGQVPLDKHFEGTQAQRSQAPNDAKAVRNYIQSYAYDDLGNIVTLRHHVPKSPVESYTRNYHHSEHGNRLLGCTLGRSDDAIPEVEPFPHDELGRITAMPHLQALHYSGLDELLAVRRGDMELSFQYAGGQRIRKWVEKGNGIIEERIYVGGVEYFRKFKPSAPGTPTEATQTEYLPGGGLVDTKTHKDGSPKPKPKPLFRHALDNHLGSAQLEVDQHGKVISYEEFHPYGTSGLRAVRANIDVADFNRYRFTGMERDDETGLQQHGARYYVPWLGRWLSADPIGLSGGINRYAYCRGSPVCAVDRDGMRPCAPDEMSDIDGCTPSDKYDGNYGTGAAEGFDDALAAEASGPLPDIPEGIPIDDSLLPTPPRPDAIGPPYEEAEGPPWWLYTGPWVVTALIWEGGAAAYNAPSNAQQTYDYSRRAIHRYAEGDFAAIEDVALAAWNGLEAVSVVAPLAKATRLGSWAQRLFGFGTRAPTLRTPTRSVAGEIRTHPLGPHDFTGQAHMAQTRNKAKVQIGPEIEASVLDGPPLAGVFKGHRPTQGFTSVFDTVTGGLKIVPSTGLRPLPSGFVRRRGGHSEVSRALGGRRSDHVGFAVILKEGGGLQITWRSGQLNKGPGYLVPERIRPTIVEAVERQTGLKVVEY